MVLKDGNPGRKEEIGYIVKASKKIRPIFEALDVLLLLPPALPGSLPVLEQPDLPLPGVSRREVRIRKVG